VSGHLDVGVDRHAELEEQVSTYVAIVGTWPASVYTLEVLKVEIMDRAPEKPEDYITLYEQRDGDYELRPLELQTGEVSRDDAFRYMRTVLTDPGSRGAKTHTRGMIDWDVKL
jgi:hypothetical protein